MPTSYLHTYESHSLQLWELVTTSVLPSPPPLTLTLALDLLMVLIEHSDSFERSVDSGKFLCREESSEPLSSVMRAGYVTSCRTGAWDKCSKNGMVRTTHDSSTKYNILLQKPFTLTGDGMHTGLQQDNVDITNTTYSTSVENTNFLQRLVTKQMFSRNLTMRDSRNDKLTTAFPAQA